MKLNLGCGHNKKPGFLNVDKYVACEPDLVYDLEVIPWPWEDNSVVEVNFNHSLEHMGENSEVFLNLICELYRVCEHGAQIQIHVPHPRHDDFLNDPTHVRAITPEIMTLFSKKENLEWQEKGFPNTSLALHLGVDFELTNTVVALDEPYLTLWMENKLSKDNLMKMIRYRNNVAKEYQLSLVVNKLY